MAPHSSLLAWKIPWTEEPGRLQSMGSQGIGYDCSLSFTSWVRDTERLRKQKTIQGHASDRERNSLQSFTGGRLRLSP